MEIIEIENSKYVYARNIFGKYYIPYDLIHRPLSTNYFKRRCMGI